jgi:TolB protein
MMARHFKALAALTALVFIAAIVVLAAFVTMGDGGSAPEGGKPEPGVSPAWLVFECTIDGKENVCSIPAGAGKALRMTREAENGCPRWTSDGKRVVFNSNRSGEWQLWEMNADGGNQRRVRKSDDRDWESDPSPDDKGIVFLSNRGGLEGVWIHERANGASRRLVQYRRRTVIGNPDWSPRGGEIVFSSNHSFGHQIYRMNLANGESERVSSLASGGCEPRFSPDGKKVAYVTRRHFKKISLILEHDIASGEERVLVGWKALNYDPVYAPDGKELAFASTIDGEEFDIYRLRLSDGRSWRVTFGPGSNRHPDYAPVR